MTIYSIIITILLWIFLGYYNVQRGKPTSNKWVLWVFSPLGFLILFCIFLFEMGLIHIFDDEEIN